MFSEKEKMQMNTKVAKKNNKGFTLIELIVVIAIIAVLAAILAPQYLRYVEKSRVSVDCQSAAEILNASRTACADESVYDILNDKDNKVVWSADGMITVSGTKDTAPNTGKLAEEVRTTVTGKSGADSVVARKSKTLSQGDFTVTITPDTANGTVTVGGKWSSLKAGVVASELDRKSTGVKSSSK